MIDLFQIFIFISLTIVFYWSAGRITTNVILKYINQSKLIENQILNIFIGIVTIGILSLIINFLYPLNLMINSIFFFVILLFGIFEINKVNYRKLIIPFISIVLISSLLIFKANNFTPDAGLYHLPFVKILNSEKIVFGLSNLHFRFGHTSIIQYNSAFLNNFIFFEKGITIMPAIISGVFLTFIINKLLNFKTLNPIYLFSFFTLVFSITYLDRYSNYGNDAPGFVFGTLSIIYFMKYLFQKRDEYLFINSLFILFSFLIKPFLIILLVLPGYIILFSFLQRRTFNKKFLILPLIIFLWLSKTIINTGCFIYPMKITCLDNLSWADKEKTKFYEVAGEAASKGYMDLIKLKKNNLITMEDFNNNLKWTSTWFDVHFFVVIEKISPYLIFLLIYLIICFFLKDRTKNNKLDIRIYIINLFFLICTIYWFFKFPIYRYGALFIFLTLTLFIIIIFNKITSKQKLIGFNKKIIFFLVIILIFINVNRIVKNFSNSTWPEVFNENNEIYEKIFKENLFIYTKSKYSCMYNKNLCTNWEINFKDFEVKRGYKFFKVKGSNF